MGIGDRVREFRERKHWSGFRLAREAGTTPTHVKAIEDGLTRSPTGKTLGKLATALGVRVDELLSDTPARAAQVAEAPATYGASAVFAVPLLALGVGAGEPTLRLEPGGDRPYHFRRDWLARKGWSEANRDRFGVYRLGSDEVAASMFPTIQPESVLLVDLQADRRAIPPRSIWVLSIEGGLAVKRVTADGRTLILESDNPDPEYAPRILPVSAAERTRILEGRVIWYATEVG